MRDEPTPTPTPAAASEVGDGCDGMNFNFFHPLAFLLMPNGLFIARGSDLEDGNFGIFREAEDDVGFWFGNHHYCYILFIFTMW